MRIPDRLLPKIWNRFVWLNALIIGVIKAFWLLLQTLYFRKCYYGPFVGEFGHLLGHNLPFLAWLKDRNIEIIYCGTEVYRPLMVGDNGEEVVDFKYPIKDIFDQYSPRADKTDYPDFAKEIMAEFVEDAQNSNYPFWDLRDIHFYFIAFRMWMHWTGFVKLIDFSSKSEKNVKENAIAIFPRKKGISHNKNNGAPWDYEEIIRLIKPYVDKIYLVGHPAFSFNIPESPKVELVITSDNKEIAKKCIASKLIITQHSGTVYFAQYCDTPVLVIYNGEPPIGNIAITKKVIKSLGDKHPMSYCYSYGEIESFVKEKFSSNK